MHVAGADYVREAIVTREKDALMTLLRHGSDQHSAPFIQEALNLVEEREYALSKPVEISAQKSADESKLVSGVQMMNLENVVSYKDAFEAEEDAKIEKIEAREKCNLSPNTSFFIHFFNNLKVISNSFFNTMKFSCFTINEIKRIKQKF